MLFQLIFDNVCGNEVGIDLEKMCVYKYAELQTDGRQSSTRKYAENVR